MYEFHVNFQQQTKKAMWVKHPFRGHLTSARNISFNLKNLVDRDKMAVHIVVMENNNYYHL